MDFDLAVTEDFKNAGEELEVSRCRVRLAIAYTQLLHNALDAHVHHGVNIQKLPEWGNHELLDEGHRLPVLKGEEKLLEWIRRAQHGLDAALRRKAFRDMNAPGINRK